MKRLEQVLKGFESGALETPTGYNDTMINANELITPLNTLFCFQAWLSGKPGGMEKQSIMRLRPLYSISTHPSFKRNPSAKLFRCIGSTRKTAYLNITRCMRRFPEDHQIHREREILMVEETWKAWGETSDAFE
jgi:hypothetical protein